MFEAEAQGVHKHIRLEDDSLLVEYSFSRNHGDTFRVEINLAMPSCDGPAGRFRIAGEIPGGFGQRHEIDNLKQIALEDDVLGGALHVHTSLPCTFVSAPHFSVSQSEAGFEKIMQAVTLELSWPIAMIKNHLTVRINIF